MGARRNGAGHEGLSPRDYDAVAGVEAGCAGRFGLVIGVDHSGQSQTLREAGADVVVTSRAQVQVTTESPSAWSLVYEGFDPASEGTREALCTLGNGYFSTRGAVTWARADGIDYPGTYLPAATIDCAPTLPVGRSRARIS